MTKFEHYGKAIQGTQTPDAVRCDYATAVHDLARITRDLRLYKKSSTRFKIAANFHPNYHSVFLSCYSQDCGTTSSSNSAARCCALA